MQDKCLLMYEIKVQAGLIFDLLREGKLQMKSSVAVHSELRLLKATKHNILLLPLLHQLLSSLLGFFRESLISRSNNPNSPNIYEKSQTQA